MMTRQELILAAEAKLRDAESNLATCVQSMNEHNSRGGQELNIDVVTVTQVQAAIAQVYATLATAGDATV